MNTSTPDRTRGTVHPRGGVGRILLSVTAALVVLVAGACGGEAPTEKEAAPDPVTVYSSRAESLMGPLFERFTEETGIQVSARYGDGPALVDTVLRDGEAAAAQVFIARDVASLGRLSAEGKLQRLPPQTLMRAPERYRSAGGDWVGLSSRVRVLAMNDDRVSREGLPASLDGVTEERYLGRFALAPSDPSFVTHMAAVHAVEGPEALRRLLEGLAGNEPVLLEDEAAVVEAVSAGDVDFGLADHAAVWRVREGDPAAPVRDYFFPGGGVSTFIDVSGAGVLDDSSGARRLLEFLMSNAVQETLAAETFEYPAAEGVPPATQLIPLEELRAPDVAAVEVAASLPEARRMISEAGLTE